MDIETQGVCACVRVTGAPRQQAAVMCGRVSVSFRTLFRLDSCVSAESGAVWRQLCSEIAQMFLK